MSTTNTAGTVFDRLETRKTQVLETLKRKGAPVGLKARVIFILDRSISMQDLYTDGTVQELIERTLPIGMTMDDNQSIEFYAFHNSALKMPEVTQNNIKNYVNKNIKMDWGGTEYAPVLQMVCNDLGVNLGNAGSKPSKSGWLSKILGDKPAQASGSNETIKFPDPVFIIFVTDGDNSDKAVTEDLMRRMSKFGIFVQFMGIGNASLAFLEKLDNLSGTFIDNSNFFRVPQLDKMSDNQLYDLLLTEFPSWIKKAKQHNLID